MNREEELYNCRLVVASVSAFFWNRYSMIVFKQHWSRSNIVYYIWSLICTFLPFVSNVFDGIFLFVQRFLWRVISRQDKRVRVNVRINVAISWIPSPRRHLHATRESTPYCKIDFSASTLDENTFPLCRTLCWTLIQLIRKSYFSMILNSFCFYVSRLIFSLLFSFFFFFSKLVYDLSYISYNQESLKKYFMIIHHVFNIGRNKILVVDAFNYYKS